METSAKANINIENVSTDAFCLYLLSSLCKPAVGTVAHPGGMQGTTDGLLSTCLAGGASGAQKEDCGAREGALKPGAEGKILKT